MSDRSDSATSNEELEPTQGGPAIQPDQTADPGSTKQAEVRVVGIGASAGGLEVFNAFLRNFTCDSGLAIVFVQHLDPSHESILPQLLSKATEMSVKEAEQGMALEANVIYVMPANVDVSIESGLLQLRARSHPPSIHRPIDHFFQSAAVYGGTQAIGVVLSGTGSDGSAGLEAIRAAGGITFAQDPATAKFDAMPQSAIATGCVDFVLPVERIAEELSRVVQHLKVSETVLPETRDNLGEDERHLAAILAILRESTGIDFSLYRQKMVMRRIRRRLALSGTHSLAEYADRLRQAPEELSALHRDLLINVTSFFRDEESFDSLSRVVFPRILQNRHAEDPIRVWVAGCATGEEAYSVAITLDEYMTANGKTYPVKVFASDISDPALAKARRGQFNESIESDLSPERLKRYFTKADGQFRVTKRIREMCIFSRHNLVDDPPFSRLDLITCRNVLIYLGNVQNGVIPLFHYALKQPGFLMLGRSEAAAASDLFDEADHEHRIYSRRDTARRRILFPSGPVSSGRTEADAGVTEVVHAKTWQDSDTRREVDRILLSRYSPAGVVVDDQLEVLEIRGKSSPYLRLPAGRISLNLEKLIPDIGLFRELEDLVAQVRTRGEAVRKEKIPCFLVGESRDLDVDVIPLSSQSASTLILIVPSVPEANTERASLPPSALIDLHNAQIARLTQQLEEANERFFAATDDFQLSHEECQNSTQEALSSNEELQSLNEELETAKEELQSTNQELVTLNEELETRNAALAEARDFAMSIIGSVRQPLVVLDLDLRIRLANQAFRRTFQVSLPESDLPAIGTIANGAWDFPELTLRLRGLIEDGLSFTDVEVERELPHLGSRTLLLGGSRINHLRIILLAVDDITERKLAEEIELQEEERARQSQKLEAIGRLAGGIAHDFNNLLSVIIGYSSMLCDQLAENESACKQASEIKLAGERAASLTRQLLSFSKRQVLQPQVLNLNQILGDLEGMLRQLAGEKIDVKIECEPTIWQVLVDPGEIGRAIVNLMLNAKDAIPEFGAIHIRTANVVEPHPEGPQAGPERKRRFVSLSVVDTGVGIDAQLRSKIFEPFFTTKETGKGTGLGLPTVLGIVEQSGGVVRCDSQPGDGTTFTILLPAANGSQAAFIPQEATPALDSRGAEVILLVEDNDAVRMLACELLRSNGYQVIEARHGQEGVVIAETVDGRIDLLLTDVVMPGMGGRELAERLHAVRPEMKVMFMSGHTEDEVLREGVEKGMPFLHKPFTPDSLSRKVRSTLDARVPNQSSASSTHSAADSESVAVSKTSDHR